MDGDWEGEFALAEVTSDAVKALRQRSQRRGGGGRGACARCCFHMRGSASLPFQCSVTSNERLWGVMTRLRNTRRSLASLIDAVGGLSQVVGGEARRSEEWLHSGRRSER